MRGRFLKMEPFDQKEWYDRIFKRPLATFQPGSREKLKVTLSCLEKIVDQGIRC